MTDVSDLVFLRFESNIVDHLWQIMQTKLIEAVVKEFIGILVLVGVKRLMRSGVLGSSIVSKPDIIASFGRSKCWRFLLTHDPGISTREQTMLKEDHWCSSWGVWSLNVE